MPNFWKGSRPSRKFLGLVENFFGPKIFLDPKNFFDQKFFFWPKKFVFKIFLPRSFSTKYFFRQRIFSTKRNFCRKTFSTKFFPYTSQIIKELTLFPFSDHKFFWGQNNFLGLKHLRLKFFQSKIFFGLKFFQTKNYCS